ncbi:MAG: amidohydrolase [Deltaproteobacteria bacterium]|nr:amidohydrolase [Deltaproteobacteria bacterium]
MSPIPAIDIMNHPPEARRDLGRNPFEFKEFQIMMQTTFKSVFRRPERNQDAGGAQPPGEKKAKRPRVLTGHGSVAELITDMDRLGYQYIVITATKMWSYHYHHQLILDYSIDDVGQIVAESNGRIIGAASYSPFRIEESLQEVERGVKQFGFKYVWFHPLSFGLAPNDRRFYPLYAKCNELDIAVGMQVGHSAEVLPSDVGRPMLADDVAIDFPNLRINLSHTGWPWVDEWCSMLWRHPNVYGDISAYFPKSLDERQVRFMDSSRGRDKVLFGTNGLGIEACLQQFLALPVKEETKQRVLHDNAIEFLKLG